MCSGSTPVARGNAVRNLTRIKIEGYLMQCNVYLEDCSKRETL